MPNAATHRIVAGLVAGGFAALEESRNGESSGRPLAAGGIGALAGARPDLLEPASHPRHRQFFHSAAFAVGVGYAWYRCCKWEPKSAVESTIRLALLCGGLGCLVHLIQDGFTPAGLPLIGRCGPRGAVP